MAKTRRPKNQAQAQFFDLAVQHGWTFTSRGWPTYFVQSGGKTVAVEVVSSPSRKLRKDKSHVMRVLQELGVECYTWNPETGFTSLGDSATLPSPVGGRGQAVPLPSNSKDDDGGEGSRGEGAAAPSEPQEVREAVDRIWACFVSHMHPTSTVAGEEERKIIRAALKVATEKECCEAIEGCRLSDYHQGDNPQSKRYNTISHILRGKRGRKTTREQIDMFLDIRGKAITSGRTVSTTADPAVVGQRKDEVRRGFRLKGDADAVKKGKEAEQWLARQGIVTERRADGYPIWPSGGNA